MHKYEFPMMNEISMYDKYVLINKAKPTTKEVIASCKEKSSSLKGSALGWEFFCSIQIEITN